jgi:toxin ParE1/3/4
VRVIWSAEAVRCLRQIVDYIAQDSPGAARKVAARLLLRSQRLEQLPLPGRHMHEYPADELYELLERPYRMIYRRTHEGIEIVTIKHYRQRLPDVPPGRR